MGWTLFACFGCTKKRKRSTKTWKSGCRSRKTQSYQELQSDVPEVFGAPGTLGRSNLQLRDEQKDEKKRARERKKVRFNLNVVAYEPIPAFDDARSLHEEDEKNWDESEEEGDAQAAAEAVRLVYAALSNADATGSEIQFKPLSTSHRYSSFYEDEHDYYEDDDEDTECEISDLDDDDDYDSSHCGIKEEHQLSSMPLITSADRKLRITKDCTTNARFRSHYITPVLNPIENTSHWKAIKARKC